jgi:hypothetical protein
MMMTNDRVPYGPCVHFRPGKTLPRYVVFSSGMSPRFWNAGVATTSLAPCAAGKLSIAKPGAAGGGVNATATEVTTSRATASSGALSRTVRPKCILLSSRLISGRIVRLAVAPPAVVRL